MDLIPPKKRGGKREGEGIWKPGLTGGHSLIRGKKTKLSPPIRKERTWVKALSNGGGPAPKCEGASFPLKKKQKERARHVLRRTFHDQIRGF